MNCLLIVNIFQLCECPVHGLLHDPLGGQVHHSLFRSLMASPQCCRHVSNWKHDDITQWVDSSNQSRYCGVSVQRNSHAVIPLQPPWHTPNFCQCSGLQPNKKPIKVQTAAAIPLTSCRSHCMLLTAYPKKVDHVEHNQVISPHQLSSSGLPIATCVHLKRLSATCQHQNLVHCCCENHWTQN